MLRPSLRPSPPRTWSSGPPPSTSTACPPRPRRWWTVPSASGPGWRRARPAGKGPLVLAALAAARPRGEQLFTGSLLGLKYFFASFGARIADTRTLRGLACPEDLLSRPDLCADLERWGRDWAVRLAEGPPVSPAGRDHVREGRPGAVPEAPLRRSSFLFRLTRLLGFSEHRCPVCGTAWWRMTGQAAPARKPGCWPTASVPPVPGPWAVRRGPLPDLRAPLPWPAAGQPAAVRRLPGFPASLAGTGTARPVPRAVAPAHLAFQARRQTGPGLLAGRDAGRCRLLPAIARRRPGHPPA